jgi:hypothetical protein
MTIVFPNHQDSLARLASEARQLADALDRLAVDGQPNASDMADAPTLTDWWIGMNDTPALRGKISEPPDAHHAGYIDTANLFAMDYNARWARTWSGWYRLDVKAAPLRKRPL